MSNATEILCTDFTDFVHSVAQSSLAPSYFFLFFFFLITHYLFFFKNTPIVSPLPKFPNQIFQVLLTDTDILLLMEKLEFILGKNLTFSKYLKLWLII